MEITEITNNRIPYAPAILLLSIHPKNNKKYILIQKDICSAMFTKALFTIAKIWKQPK